MPGARKPAVSRDQVRPGLPAAIPGEAPPWQGAREACVGGQSVAAQPEPYAPGIRPRFTLDFPMSSVAVFSKASPLDALQRWLPKLVLAPAC